MIKASVRKSDRVCPRCAGQHIEDEKYVVFEFFGDYDLHKRFSRLYRGTGGPTHPACMQRLMNYPNQAAVAQLVHLIDERHQEPLCDLVWDDFQDALW
jgi:hypothetical protein